MLRAAISLFILGLIAFFLGAYNIAGVTIELGRILLLVFIGLSILSLLISLVSGRKSKKFMIRAKLTGPDSVMRGQLHRSYTLNQNQQ